MKAAEQTRFETELGKALCDRLGLDHNSTLRDYETEGAGNTVWVSMTTTKAMSLDEFNELVKVAAERATA